MTMSRVSIGSSCLSRGALRPAEHAGDDTYCTQREPGRPDLALVDLDEPAEEADHREDHRGEDDQRGEQAVHDAAADGPRRRDGAVSDRDDRAFDRVGRFGGPVAHPRAPGAIPGSVPVWPPDSTGRRYFVNSELVMRMVQSAWL